MILAIAGILSAGGTSPSSGIDAGPAGGRIHVRSLPGAGASEDGGGRVSWNGLQREDQSLPLLEGRDRVRGGENRGSDPLRFLIPLATVGALLGGTLYLLRRKETLGRGGSSEIRILSRRSLASGRDLFVVCVSGRNLLVGCSRDGMRLLCELPSGGAGGSDSGGGEGTVGTGDFPEQGEAGGSCPSGPKGRG